MQFDPGVDRFARFEAMRPALEAWESLCSDLGHSPATVATAWLVQAPGVTAPIVGPRTEAQLDAALEAVDLELDADMLDRIDQIFPGPGAAPEAYAW
ncbi:MAG: aldo/keto reductase [Acidimicrobiales bacterium]